MSKTTLNFVFGFTSFECKFAGEGFNPRTHFTCVTNIRINSANGFMRCFDQCLFFPNSVFEHCVNVLPWFIILGLNIKQTCFAHSIAT